MRSSKILLTALTAALVLGAAVGTTSARRFEVSNQRFRVVWTALEFTGREPFGGTLRITCPVTLEGSLHSRTLSKVSGQLVGYITSANLTRPCNGGEAWILNGSERLWDGTTPTTTLPWHIRYDSFTGTLPIIEAIRVQLVGAAFLIRGPLGVNCLFRSTAAAPAFGFLNREAGGNISGLRADETSRILRSEGTAGCPPEGSFAGEGTVTLQGTTTKIRVTLVQ
jgi:hypothetical protein